jgi:hypothetical protein
LSDFDLSYKFHIIPADPNKYVLSSIHFRAHPTDDTEHPVMAYVALFQLNPANSRSLPCNLMEEGAALGSLCYAGQKRVIHQGEGMQQHYKTSGAQVDKLSSLLHRGWNDFRILAQGKHIQFFLNSAQVVDCTDNTSTALLKGQLALQVRYLTPATVQYKDLRLKQLTGAK